MPGDRDAERRGREDERRPAAASAGEPKRQPDAAMATTTLAATKAGACVMCALACSARHADVMHGDDAGAHEDGGSREAKRRQRPGARGEDRRPHHDDADQKRQQRREHQIVDRERQARRPACRRSASPRSRPRARTPRPRAAGAGARRPPRRPAPPGSGRHRLPGSPRRSRARRAMARTSPACRQSSQASTVALLSRQVGTIDDAGAKAEATPTFFSALLGEPEIRSRSCCAPTMWEGAGNSGLGCLLLARSRHKTASAVRSLWVESGHHRLVMSISAFDPERTNDHGCAERAGTASAS